MRDEILTLRELRLIACERLDQILRRASFTIGSKYPRLCRGDTYLSCVYCWKPLRVMNSMAFLKEPVSKTTSLKILVMI